MTTTHQTITHLLLFDIDGTLLRTKGAGRLATHAAMTDVFGTASTLDAHHFGGKTDFLTLTELLAPEGYTFETILEKMDSFVAAMGRHMAHFIRDYPADALPGAMEAVQHYRQQPHVLLGLVTGNAPTSARVKLESAGFDPDWFPVGAFGNESINRDDLPRLALFRANQHADADLQPHQATIIGDTPLDVRAARANGMRVIAVKSPLDDPVALEAAKPDILLDDLTGLCDVLNV